MEDNYLQVGVITSTHGLKGEVKVFPTTSDPKRFSYLKKAFIDTGKEKLPVEIEQVKYFKKFVIVKFKSFNDINDMEKFKTNPILVARENAVKLSKDEYFIADLIDLNIIDEENNEIGILVDVLETGANDVYVIKMKNNKELLLPAIKQCVLDVDIPNNTMKIHILEGLLD